MCYIINIWELNFKELQMKKEEENKVKAKKQNNKTKKETSETKKILKKYKN